MWCDACLQKRGRETEAEWFRICNLLPPQTHVETKPITPNFAPSLPLMASVVCFNRVCGKMSGSNTELERCGQQGLGESPGSSPRGLGSASLPTASTDSLAADTSEEPSLL